MIKLDKQAYCFTKIRQIHSSAKIQSDPSCLLKQVTSHFRPLIWSQVKHQTVACMRGCHMWNWMFKISVRNILTTQFWTFAMKNNSCTQTSSSKVPLWEYLQIKNQVNFFSYHNLCTQFHSIRIKETSTQNLKTQCWLKFKQTFCTIHVKTNVLCCWSLIGQ